MQGLDQDKLDTAKAGDLLGYVLVTSGGKMLNDRVYPTYSEAEDARFMGSYIASYVK